MGGNSVELFWKNFSLFNFSWKDFFGIIIILWSFTSSACCFIIIIIRIYYTENMEKVFVIKKLIIGRISRNESIVFFFR